MMASSETHLVFCNENPSCIFYPEASTTPIGAVSFWRSFLSPLGSGHVLALWRTLDTGKVLVEVFTDRLVLGQMIVKTFLQHWPPFHQISLQSVSLQEGRFFVEMDVPSFYRVNCIAPKIDLVAEWRAPRSLSRHVPHTHADVRYHDSSLTVETIVGFCDQASILINGHFVEGQVRHERSEKETSAYITLCETWSQITHASEK